MSEKREVTMVKKAELLAPAGNKEAFFGAIKAGADAVYLGGSRFGARAYADNFSKEDLIECIRYAHLFDRKVYLTVNTLVREEEFSELSDYLAPFYEAGLDAVIIQDIGVFTYIRDHFPGLGLHVSTQMTITGSYGAAMLGEMGAERIVPARELSLSEIKQMKEDTGLEMECFVHGAMCYCYSGQCLFSSILGGRSGNRGRCAQPCRLPYTISGALGQSEECYPLSLKDMCTLEYLPKLMEAGIDSFKIEGRMKKPEYAAGVTAIYRKYMDAYYKDPSNPPKPSKKDLSDLANLYMRSEQMTGYYQQKNGKDMITLKNPSYSGSDDQLLEKIRRDYLEHILELEVEIEGVFQENSPALVTMRCGQTSVTVTGPIVSTAQKQPITRENVEKQLSKLGSNFFTLKKMDVTLGDNCFYPLKAINELRRQAATALEDALILENGYEAVRKCPASSTEEKSSVNDHSQKKQQGNLHVSVRTLDQLLALKDSFQDLSMENWAEENKISRVYVNGDLLLEKEMKEEALYSCKQIRAFSEVILALPPILRSRDQKFLKDLYAFYQENIAVFDGFLVRSIEGMGFLQKQNFKGKIYSDFGFYSWNRETIATWKKSLSGFCIPLELNAKQQKFLLSEDLELPSEKVVYGRIPMMLTANCLAVTKSGCLQEKKNHTKEGIQEGSVFLIDRYQKRFPVVFDCKHCTNIIYNSVVLSLHGELEKLRQKMDLRLDFTIETSKETKNVLAYFRQIMEGKNVKSQALPYEDYTTGHEKRGVE